MTTMRYTTSSFLNRCNYKNVNYAPLPLYGVIAALYKAKHIDKATYDSVTGLTSSRAFAKIKKHNPRIAFISKLLSINPRIFGYTAYIDITGQEERYVQDSKELDEHNVEQSGPPVCNSIW